jgi:hypothetical protein
VDVFPAMVGLLVGKQCLPTVTAVWKSSWWWA